MISAEAAKPLRTARVEAQRTVSTFTFSALEARSLTGEMIPMDASAAGEGKLAFTLRVPVGVIGAITPFNFPLNLVAHKVAPAIASGCPMVLKPASQTPLSSLLLAEILAESGLPGGHLNVVTGGGATVGNALVEHPDIAMITFTGSPEVGWGIRAKAARKKVGLELGNNAPVIIEPSGDWATAAKKIAVAGFSHAGQSCISTQRVYVHESIAAPFLDALVPLVDALVVGDPLSEETDVSALISTGERDRVASWVEEAVAAGADLCAGGRIRDDGVLLPTVLSGVSPTHEGVRARGVRPGRRGTGLHATSTTRFRLANDTRYGLQASIFTAGLDSRAARRTHSRLRRGARERGPDLPRRSAAVRGNPRQRQHPRGPALLGA